MGSFCSKAAQLAGVEDENDDGKIDATDVALTISRGKKRRRTKQRSAGGSGGGYPGASRAQVSSTSRGAAAGSGSSSILDINNDGKVDYKDAIAGYQKVQRVRRRVGGGGGGRGSGNRGSSTKTRASSFQPDEVMLSACNGHKRALFVGINYVGSSSELRGCWNDVENVQSYFRDTHGFTDVKVLMDDGKHENPTRANILAAFGWLTAGAKAGDSLLFHYSGHGGSTKDTTGLEADGQAETLIPVDYKSAGHIVDDDVHSALTKTLPEGVRLTSLMDCCHSGTVLDLPYLYSLDGSLQVQETDLRGLLLEGLASVGTALLQGQKARAAVSAFQSIQKLLAAKNGGGQGAQERAERLKQTQADVIQFSGCRDDQTSADAKIDSKFTGAMSWALLATLRDGGANQTYQEILVGMHHRLQNKYSQKPQLTSGRKVSMKSQFKV